MNKCCKDQKKYIFSIEYRSDNKSDIVMKCKACSWKASIVGAYPISFESDDGNGDIIETITMVNGKRYENRSNK